MGFKVKTVCSRPSDRFVPPMAGVTSDHTVHASMPIIIFGVVLRINSTITAFVVTVSVSIAVFTFLAILFRRNRLHIRLQRLTDHVNTCITRGVFNRHTHCLYRCCFSSVSVCMRVTRDIARRGTGRWKRVCTRASDITVFCCRFRQHGAHL